MDEKPKSIWNKPWRGIGSLLLAWLGLMVATLIIVFVITLASGGRFTDEELKLWMAFSLFATAIIFLVLFIRWLFCWRNFKRFLFGLACFATLIALFYAEENWRGKHDWEKFKHEWEVKGERFDWQSIVPPPVPDEQNFAMAPIWVESIKATLGGNADKWKYPDNGRTNFVDELALNTWRNDNLENEPTNGSWAKGTTTDLKSWQTYYRAPFQTNRNSTIRTNEFSISPQPQTPAQDVLLALSKYDPAIEELRVASEMPYSRFPMNYDTDHPFDILLPHLAALKRCSLVLRLRAIAELQNNESQKALDDINLSLYLINSIRSEPFLISHLVRIAMLQIMLQPIYEGLAEHKWSDGQLTDLESELAKFDLLTDFERSMRGEEAGSIVFIDYFRRHQSRHELKQMLDMLDNESDLGNHPQNDARVIAFYLMPSGWFYQNELAVAQMHQQWLLPMVNPEKHLVLVDLANRASAGLANWKPTLRNMFVGALLPVLGSSAMKFAYAQSSVDLSRVAIALERYRMANGNYPDSLDVLAPKFISEVPHDVIGGEPLHFRKTLDGQFVLYSIGWNETDDGGVVVYHKSRDSRDESNSRVDTSQGDWVWRYPQK